MNVLVSIFWVGLYHTQSLLLAYKKKYKKVIIKKEITKNYKTFAYKPCYVSNPKYLCFDTTGGCAIIIPQQKKEDI